jgi:hypothetical protein
MKMMDLLFKRYADPFSLLNGYIQTKQFARFIPEFCKQVSEDDRWEFYLHKVWGQTYPAFCESLQTTRNLQKMSDSEIAATVQTSMDILEHFNPGEEGEM